MEPMRMRPAFIYISWFLLSVCLFLFLALPDFDTDILFSLITVLAALSFGFASKQLKKLLVVLTVAFVIGMTLEVVGVHTGAVFGAKYFYQIRTPFLFFSVPFQVGIFWGLFFLISHVITNTIGLKGIFAIIGDGLGMVIIDLILDPVMVKRGVWVWPHGGPYFSVPLSNFVGWFFVAILISFVCRIIFKVSIRDYRLSIKSCMFLLVGKLLLDIWRIR